MSSTKPMTKKKICNLWGVKSSFINKKLKQIKEIIETDIYEKDLLQLLNKHGMDVEHVILDVLESDSSTINHNHNYNRNRNNNVSATNQHNHDDNYVTRKSPEHLLSSARTTLHPHLMIGPLTNKQHKWRCGNKICPKNRIRRGYQMKYYRSKQCGNAFILCKTCLESSTTPQSARTRKRKRQTTSISQAIEDEPTHKKRKLENDNHKQEAIALITSILNEHKSLTRDQILTKLNTKLIEKNGNNWRKGFHHTLGTFDDFITSIKDRVRITQITKRNFMIELKDNSMHPEIESMEIDDSGNETNTNSGSDIDIMNSDIFSNKAASDAMAMSLSLDPSESIEILSNKNDESFIFPESEPVADDTLDFDIVAHTRGISSKEERESEDEEDSEYTAEDRTTHTSTASTSMKAEADSEDECSTESDRESSVPLVRYNNIRWKTKLFTQFKFKYSITANKNPPVWLKNKFKLSSVKAVKSIRDLLDYQSAHLSYVSSIKVEYDSKYGCGDDESILQFLYDAAFEELYAKEKKPKQQLIQRKKKARRDYTIQALIKSTKQLQCKEKNTKRFSASIEMQMHRLSKSGNCFVVDIPATLALIQDSKALKEDIYESLNLMKEYQAKGHQQTSISLLDFACRYTSEGIHRFAFGEQCRICYKIPIIQAIQTNCGHRFCAECVPNTRIWSMMKCAVCRKECRYLCNDSDNQEGEEEKKDDTDVSMMQREQKKYGLTVIPFSYQVQSIQWMIRRENDKEGLYKYLFRRGKFKNGEVFYYSAVLNRLVLTAKMPVLHGGFLCEEMGLGKTIECLALIHCNKRKGSYSIAKQLVLACKENGLRKQRIEIKQKNDERKDNDDVTMRRKKKKKQYKFVEKMKEYTYYKGKGTLIIGPVSLIGQWEHEVDTRSKAGLTYTRYYGQRSRNIDEYLNFDIVFTTFGVLAKEDGHNRKNHVLHRIEWHRVILDESHYIKNGAARTSMNINELKASNKWLLSGTPFEKPLDLFNQLKFIGINQDYINAMGLKQKAVRPWHQKQYSKALLKVVKYLMMRHKKGQKFNNKPILNMTEKEEDVIYVEFDAQQKEYYDKLYATAKETFDSFSATGNIARGFIPILSSLHPARQACSGYIANIHAIEEQLSAAQENSHKIRAMVQRNSNKSSKELYELARDEAYNKDGQCVICLECPPDEPLQTPCRHIFCGECIRTQLEANGECPICRNVTNVNRLKRPLSEQKEEEKESENDNINVVEHKEDEIENKEESESIIKFDAKLKVLISELNILKREKPNDKSLIFTSFSKSLDWICCELQKNGIKYSTLTGSMTMNKRARNLKQFSDDEDVKVFVLTVRTGAVGLTLTAANHVFMMEPTFNPALHRQAINRVYRLGQEKKVFIHTLIMKDSIEERIWNINKDKQKGDIDNNKNQNMYGNIKDDKAGALQTTEIEKLFAIQ